MLSNLMQQYKHPMPHHDCRGFSLLEMAIVLMIIGLVLGGMLAAIGNSTDSIRRTNAETAMKQIEDALYGFAQANTRLPCPATNGSSGLEAIDAPVANGVCTEDHGFVPTVTLGLFGNVNSDGLLLDPWGNPYRYSVAASATGSGARAFTSVTGLSELFNNNELSTLAISPLRVCEDVTDCAGSVIIDTAPALIISMGENWATYTSADEEENAGDGTSMLGAYNVTNTSDFINTTFSEDNFDDQIRWLSPHILFTRLVQAGRLP